MIILAESFAKWDTFAVKQMGEGIELWAYTLYDANLLHLELVYGKQRTAPAVSIPADKLTNETSEPQFTYTIAGHLEGKPAHIGQLFEEVRQGIFALAGEEGDVIETANKLYISYRHGKNFCEIEVQNKQLKIHLDIPINELNDPQKLARDVSDIGHWGTGDTEIKISREQDVSYGLDLIEQAYRRTL